MKRSSWISVLAAGGLLVAGCSSSGGTAAPATTATSTSASSSSSFESSSTSSAKDTSSGGTSTKASAAQLDAATETWFTTFCISVADIGQYAKPDTTGKSVAEAQSTVVASYTSLSASATKAAGAIQATPPPTIASGAEISAAFVTGFQDLADIYGRGAQTVASLTPSTEADIQTAIDAVDKEVKDAGPDSFPDLDPGVEAAVEQLPECSVLGS